MGNSRLPPDVSLRDVDEAFGEPEYHTQYLEATVDVALSEDCDPEPLLDISAPDAEVVHVEHIEESVGEYLKAVYVGFTVETQFRDADDIRSDGRAEFDVEAADERVTHVKHICTEVR